MLLALALRDESIGGAEAAELADRALELTRQSGGMDPPAALEAAKQDRGSSPSRRVAVVAVAGDPGAWCGRTVAGRGGVTASADHRFSAPR